jgi:YidC/Oxa1 family membrane protein insertase
MTFFDYILAPFVFLLKEIFLFCYAITGSYGLSIVLLSLAVSLILLPVFIYIERSRKKDLAVKQKMKPVLDEIKRCYKGQERYYYIKTLNRQHGYNPMRALIPTLSLLLQIPFFIAAYQFLENFDPLAGTRFLFIDDLSKADGLWGHLNFLPIAMTFINLVTAYFYTRHSDTSERKQMVIVAAIFLILLYNLPSGLVLYWTMNNVFSFFRLFITNPEVFKSTKATSVPNKITLSALKLSLLKTKPRLMKAFFVILVIALLTQLNRAFEHNFDDILQRILFSVLTSFGIIFLLAFLIISYNLRSFSNQYSITGRVKEFYRIFKSLLFFLILIAVITQINWALMFSFDDILIRLILAILVSVVATIILGLVIIAFQLDYNYTWRKRIVLSLSEAGKAYKTVFVFLAVSLSATQVNWAIHFEFDDIIFRLTFVITASWLILILCANVVNLFKNQSVINLKNFRSYFRKNQKTYLISYIIFLLVGVYSQLNWAYQFNFDDFHFRMIMVFLISTVLTGVIALISFVVSSLWQAAGGVKIGKGVVYSFIFLSIYFYLASIFYLSGVNEMFSIISLIFSTILNIILLHNFILYGKRFQHVIYIFITSLIFLVSVLLIIQLLPYIFNNELEILLSGFIIYVCADGWHEVTFFSVILSTLLLVASTYISEKRSNEKLPAQHRLLLILSVVYLTGNIFLLNPIQVYSSSPLSFGFQAIDIVTNNATLFLIVSIIPVLVYRFLGTNAKKILLILFLSMVIFSLFNIYFLPLNMGTLQGHRFSDMSALEADSIYYFIEAFSIIVLFIFVAHLIKRNYYRQILSVLIILISIPLVQAANYLFFTDNPKPKYDFKEEASTISFSKDQKNVLVIMLDMFQGWYFDKMIEERPELLKTFNGFVYYPNIVAVSNYTISSFPSLIAGPEYTPDILNRDTIADLKHKMTMAGKVFSQAVKNEGYFLTGNMIPWTRNPRQFFDRYLPGWHTDWDVLKPRLSIGVKKELMYNVLWGNSLFFAAPLSLKPVIYNEGNWMQEQAEGNENTELTVEYNFLRALPYISNTNSNKNNFIWINSKTTHFPFDMIDENGKLIQNVTPYENVNWAINEVAQWMEWLKSEGVYNNTKIIIVSDHGIRHKGEQALITNPFTPPDSKKIPWDDLCAFTPLLLVKDFQADGILQKNDLFLSTSDVLSIALETNDPTKVPPPQKSRTLKAYSLDWRIKYDQPKFRINHTYEIRDNVYYIDNWERVSK